MYFLWFKISCFATTIQPFSLSETLPHLFSDPEQFATWSNLRIKLLFRRILQWNPCLSILYSTHPCGNRRNGLKEMTNERRRIPGLSARRFPLTACHVGQGRRQCVRPEFPRLTGSSSILPHGCSTQTEHGQCTAALELQQELQGSSALALYPQNSWADSLCP